MQPGTTPAKAPQIAEVVGQVIAPVVKSLPKTSKLTVTTVINGKTVNLGSVKTNANGTVTIPGFTVTKPGTYTVQLTNAKGVKYFVKVVVKAKK